MGARLPDPKSSLIASRHTAACATSKYGYILSLVTWLARSKKVSGSILAFMVGLLLLAALLFRGRSSSSSDSYDYDDGSSCTASALLASGLLAPSSRRTSELRARTAASQPATERESGFLYEHTRHTRAHGT